MTSDPETVMMIALDDHDHAWREMLIPFVVSLRQTNYVGRIGVIAYGMSEEKLQILRDQDIDIVPAARKTTLACDRFLSAANYVAENKIDRAALYDADVWFQPGGFDLFDQLTDPARMYAALDTWFCDFITTPIIGPNSDYLLNLARDSVFDRFGTAFQAGLIAGSREAWSHFGYFINDCFDRIGTDFNLTFGLDTTFVNLYAGLGNVVQVDKVYNFVSKWGIRESIDYASNKVVLTCDGARIQALHMTGDVRYEPCWRYSNVYGDVLMDMGRPLLTGPDRTAEANADIAFEPADFDWQAIGLRLVSAKGAGEVVTSPGLFQTLFGDPRPGAAYWAIGPTRLEFQATRRVELDILTTFLFGGPTPSKLTVRLKSQEAVVYYPAATSLTLDVGETLGLETDSIDRSASRMAWGLRLR